MTTTTRTPVRTTVEQVLDAAASLAPAISARSAEVEAARELPPDLLGSLVDAGCFRVLLPRTLGGVEASLPDAMRVVEVLGRADGAVGWTVMIGAGTWHDLAALPRTTLDDLYASGPDVLIAGVFSPAGVAVPVDGGYRVSGRWAFASGCSHAHRLYGTCVEETAGGPRLRIALFEPDEVTIEDTWHAVGLRGTGSHHFRADEVAVPAGRTCALFEDEPTVDAPAARIPAPAFFSLLVGSLASGLARGALDELAGVAATRVPLLAATALAGNPTFQHRLAGCDTRLRAARALLGEVAEELWAAAVDGEQPPLDLRARVRAAAAWAVETAADVVTDAYHAGGGGALYDVSPLQRRLRDVHAVTQHFLVRADTFTTAGAVLAGQEIDVPVF